MDFANYINTENSVQTRAVIPADEQISDIVNPSYSTSYISYQRNPWYG